MRTQAASTAVLAGLLPGGCDARVCSEPGVCWASRADLRAAAARCGADNFEPREAAGTWLPYVAGEDPDTGPKTGCIVDDLQGQGLMVTH